MKLLCLTLLALPFLAFSQAEKGVIPTNPKSEIQNPKSVRAVVIGISNYQDDAIPDLRFADRDAEAFANFLRSPAGGSLDADHLKLLTDSAATTAQFDAALGWLIDESKPGDQAIIYFSGHGDVETKTRSQQGFLLCWDSPPQAYVSGAYPIFFLKEVVSTLSLENKTRVIVITDACRSGKLAGNSIGGSQLTSQNLSQQFASEIKILSCQPNEYSIEGEQWGGGRGAFSFHLLDGLYGMADGNSDASVSLFEIGRYLEDRVTTEVAPISQVPMVLGNRTEKLASVDTKLLASLRSGKTNQMAILSAIESRGLEDDVLAGVDTSIRRRYHLFKKALKDKAFFEPAEACADAYFETLMAEPKLARLHPSMRRNYAAALQDEAQQVMNTMLKTGLTNEVLDGDRPSEIYKNHPLWLNRASELLGKEHYMYPILQARKHFFLGKIAEKRLERRRHFQKALEWQPDQVQAYAELIGTCSASEADSAQLFAAKAMEISPQWVVPYTQLARFYESAMKQPEKADSLLNEATKRDSGSVLVFFTMASFFEGRERFDQAEHFYKQALAGVGKEVRFNYAYLNLGDMYIDLSRYEDAEGVLLQAVQLDSTHGGTLNRLGKVYWRTGRFEASIAAFKKQLQLDKYKKRRIMAFNELGNVYSELGKFQEADEYYLKTIEVDSLWNIPYLNIALNYRMQHRYADAERIYLKLVQGESFGGAGKGYAYMLLGILQLDMGKPEEAAVNCKKGIALDPSRENYYNYACFLAKSNHLDEAFEALEKSHYDFDWIQKDPDIAPLRAKEERWKALMKKNYPDKVKD